LAALPGEYAHAEGKIWFLGEDSRFDRYTFPFELYGEYVYQWVLWYFIVETEYAATAEFEVPGTVLFLAGDGYLLQNGGPGVDRQ
jgi:hypothetical protein